MERIGIAFDSGAVLAGAVSGLILAVLLRIPAVALPIAIGISAVLAWSILADPAGPTALFEAATERLGQLVSTGFLTGALVAKSLASILQGLGRALGPRRRQ